MMHKINFTILTPRWLSVVGRILVVRKHHFLPRFFWRFLVFIKHYDSVLNFDFSPLLCQKYQCTILFYFISIIIKYPKNSKNNFCFPLTFDWVAVSVQMFFLLYYKPFWRTVFVLICLFCFKFLFDIFFSKFLFSFHIKHSYVFKIFQWLGHSQSFNFTFNI